MSSDFHSEMTAWLQVFLLRKKTLVFFSLLLFVLTSMFFLSVWQMKMFSSQLDQLTGELQLIAEITDGLPEEQRVMLQESLSSLPGVREVEYRDEEAVVGYIDQHLFSGYQEFLQKYQLEAPVNALFLLHLTDISARNDLLEILDDRYPSQLILADTPSLENDDAFSFQFISHLRSLHLFFQILVWLTLFSLFSVSAYMTAFVLSERSRGFHLTQLLHLSAPYTFWPAFCLSFLISFSVVFLSFLASFFFLGEFLLTLAVMLFVALLVLDMILLWFGRYVVVKWGMR